MTTDYFAGDDRSNFERMIAGDYYVANDPDIERRGLHAQRLSDEYRTAVAAEDPAARKVLQELVGTLGDEAEVRAPLFVDYGFNTHIGDRTFINFNLTSLDVAEVRIGSDCQIGPNVQLLTAMHPLEPGPRRDKLEKAEPITLEDNVWLGGGVIVLPGITIGENSVVGAGAVVTKNIPPNVVAVGNPARVIKTL